MLPPHLRNRHAGGKLALRLNKLLHGRGRGKSSLSRLETEHRRGKCGVHNSKRHYAAGVWRRRGGVVFPPFASLPTAPYEQWSTGGQQQPSSCSRFPASAWPQSNNMARTSFASFVELGFEFLSLSPAHTGVLWYPRRARFRCIETCRRNRSAPVSVCS